MRKKSSKIISSSSFSQGFVYVPETEDGPIKNARVGSIIRNVDQRPPWIVVDRSLESVLVAKWPGKMWKVEIIKALAEQPDSVLYIRAVAVRVLAEHPVSQLFGPHGIAVCKVIEKAQTLELKDVQALERSNISLLHDTYSRVWDKWLTQVNSDSSHHGESLIDLLSISKKNLRSPIGEGFSVLYSVLAERARDLVGEKAFMFDREGNQSFAPDWSNACSALLAAAMAYGAPEWMSPAERDLLLSAWVNTFGVQIEK